MKPSFTTRRTCRLCGSGELSLALPLKPTPIGDNYLTTDQLGVAEEIFNLDVYSCETCGQVQLRDVVSPDLLYPEFPYVTSVSVGLPEHFRRFAGEVMNRHAIPAGSLVVEIGSNEGPMLRAFKERGCRVLGVEPAGAIARAATAAGVPTLARYFNRGLGAEILATEGSATVIAAANVLANIDDLDDVFAGITTLLAPDGVVVMETSYWADVVAKGLIDTIYHEHISYFSVGPLKRFFARHGLELIAVDHNFNKGGSIRLTAQRAGGQRPVDGSVAAHLAREAQERIHSAETFAACRSHLDRITASIQETVASTKKANRSLAGYGGSVGTTTMVHEFGLGSELDYILDDNARKHGKYSPGFHIPCVPSTEFEIRQPGCVVVFAWRYLDRIQKQHPELSSGQGRLLLPLPHARLC